MKKLTLQQFLRFLKERGMYKIYLTDLKRLERKAQAKDVEKLVTRYNSCVVSYSLCWMKTKSVTKYKELDEKLKMVCIKLSS